jgi:hypothetical protein
MLKKRIQRLRLQSPSKFSSRVDGLALLSVILKIKLIN